MKYLLIIIYTTISIKINSQCNGMSYVFTETINSNNLCNDGEYNPLKVKTITGKQVSYIDSEYNIVIYDTMKTIIALYDAILQLNKEYWDKQEWPPNTSYREKTSTFPMNYISKDLILFRNKHNNK